MLSGVRPGKLFGVVRARAVRGGEVKRMRSLGRGTKVCWLASSITQLGETQVSIYCLLWEVLGLGVGLQVLGGMKRER